MTYPGALPHDQQLAFDQQNHAPNHHVVQYGAEPQNVWPPSQQQQQQQQQYVQQHHQQQQQQQYQQQVQHHHQHHHHQQQQAHHQHQHVQQQQQQQYQNNMNMAFAPAVSNAMYPQHAPSHRFPQPLAPPQHQQQQHQQQLANYQLHGYDPSFDQRPYTQAQQQPHGIHPSAQMMQPVPQPISQQQQPISSPIRPGHLPPPSPPPLQQQQSTHSHSQQRQAQQLPQHMEWQHMPPPISVASPSPATYQPVQAQTQAQQPQPQPQQQQQQHRQQQQSQQQHYLPQHVHPPAPVHSPQLQHQRVNSPIMPPHSPNTAPHAMSNTQHRTPAANARIDHVARVSASPRLTSQNATRSPSVSSTRSPALAPALIPHQDTTSLLICMAEDFFAKAKRGVRDVARTLDERSVHEYQKLVATGLACLEVAIAGNKLAPRLEALARLRYANILITETNNVMEAETALTKGITLCERNRFADLKYCMQFLQVQLLFSQRKEKAAIIAVDRQIRDADVVKHTHWVYAFRFLKASFYLQSLNPTEAHALENLRAITVLASQRGDYPISAVASLLEALSHLRAMKDDAIVRIQACIAQASKYQLADSMSIMQLDVLQLVLDLACSLQQKSPQIISQKLRALQDKMDISIRDTSGSLQDTQLFLPIHKQVTNQQIISQDTSNIVRPGEDGDAFDYLAMSFWSKLEAFTTTYTYSGLALLYQQPRSDKKLFSLWEEALGQLRINRTKIRGFAYCLEDAVEHVHWENEAACYLYILRGLHLATSTKWDEVKYCVTQLEAMVTPASGGTIVLYSMYLAGVSHQGTGDLETAINIYSHPNFSLDADEARGHRRPADFEVALLAAFNMLWIMQDPNYRNDQRTQELLEQLRPLCIEHPNMEIRTAYNLVMAAIQTNPPVPMTAVKTHISTALSNAKNLADVHTLSIALNLMRAKLFQSIVGDQALKSAKAASTQARRSGNTLWMSVADGMLSQSYEVQGAMLEAQKVWNDATHFANQAFKTSAG